MKKTVGILGALAGVGILACSVFGLVKKNENDVVYVDGCDSEPVEDQADEDDEDSDEE